MLLCRFFIEFSEHKKIIYTLSKQSNNNNKGLHMKYGTVQKINR